MYENTVRQLYVAKKFVGAGSGTISDAGDIKLMKSRDGKKFYFQFKDKGGISCTDLIEFDKVRDITICKPVGLTMHKHVVKVDETLLDTDAGNSGNMIPGEMYGLHVTLRDWGGIETYRMKDAFVLGKKGMTPYDFYVKMKESFEKQFTTANDKGIFDLSFGNVVVGGITFAAKRPGIKVKISSVSNSANAATETTGTVDLKLKTTTETLDDINTALSATNVYAVAGGTASTATTAVNVPCELIITELAPLYKQDFVKMIETNASMYADTIMVNGASEHWGTVTKSVSSYTGNARKTAEWERFYMRARGENDGYLGYPYCDPAELMIQNPGINDNFWYLEISYLFRGEGMVNTDSPKSLTIVASTSDENTSAAGVFAVPNTAGSGNTPTNGSLDKVDATSHSVATVMKGSSDFGSANLLYNILGSDYLNRDIRFVYSK